MSYYKKIKYIDRLIDEAKFNKALVLIHNYVEQVFVNNYYSFKFLAFPELDNLCKKIALKNSNYCNPKLKKKLVNKKVNIYLATKLDFGGGHTKKIIDFINSSSYESIVILSEIQGKSFIDNFKVKLSNTSKCKIILSPNFSFFDKYQYILTKLAIFNINRIYLFNSHQDSILTTVASHYFKKVYFYHHGDHNPCLGVTLFMYHIDTSHSLNSICKNYHKNTNNILLSKNYSFDFLKYDSFDNFNIVSICKSNKINIIFLFYAAFVSRYSDKYIHIGNLNLSHKIFLKFMVFLFNIFRNNNFKIYENVTNLRGTLETENINAYLASFPKPAFLTLLEISYLGIVTLTNKNYFKTTLNNSEFLNKRSRFDYDSLTSLKNLLNKLKKQDVLKFHNQIKKSLHKYNRKINTKKKLDYDHIKLLSSYKRFIFLISSRYYMRMIRRIFYL